MQTNMKWTNYHTHSKFCDGNATTEEMILSAIAKNVYAYGFSGHSPVPMESDWNMQNADLPEYFAQIEYLMNKYQDKILIFKGMEIDYIENLCGPKDFKTYNLDYCIGSVHYIKPFDDGTFCTVDHTAEKFKHGLVELFENDIKLFSAFYYQQVMNMISSDKPDIIGHIDLIKKFNKGNRFFDENETWYKKQVMEVLEVVKNQNVIIEVNTRGFYKNLTKQYYPSDWILKECKKMNIPVTISADAHTVSEINKEYENVANLLIETGYKEIMIYDSKGWYLVPFTNQGVTID